MYLLKYCCVISNNSGNVKRPNAFKVALFRGATLAETLACNTEVLLSLFYGYYISDTLILFVEITSLRLVETNEVV